ncbi:hypothetical protein IE81DRAFT_290862 [Ceraceosorus guamensis]|uniref:Uncharacterized protein n=1 Tax=Ceraceosorus guamensis TaxID=1522189 RepID=A0A316W023_9BASI|nr:hypothetical protein IE81DRAFT_290862 [Ceraceosorus guamensis]PWN42053.1 hypothetical protein IE81DRAFT_290862 [Ceraceosorus guamensis]
MSCALRTIPRLRARAGPTGELCKCARPSDYAKSIGSSVSSDPWRRSFASNTSLLRPRLGSSYNSRSIVYGASIPSAASTRGFGWSSWGSTAQVQETDSGANPAGEASNLRASSAPSDGETLTAAPAFDSSSNVLGEGSLQTAAADATSSISSQTVFGTLGELLDRSLQPVVDLLCNLPSILHLEWISHPYAISILIFTFALRTTFTLPMTLWARSRQQRLVDKVLPEWNTLKERLPDTVRRECRARGDSFEQFQKEFRRRSKSELKTLLTVHRCAPMPSILAPVAVSLPLFVLLSYSLRLALQTPAGLAGIGSEVLPWWKPSPDLEASFKASAEILKARGLEGEALQEITQSYGPKLTEIDRTSFGPISLCFMTLANVEWMQWLRRKTGGWGVSANEASNAVAQTGRKAGKPGDAPAVQEEESLRMKIVGNALRLLAICFVIISSQVPSALLIYWLSSAFFTLCQTGTLAAIDRRRARNLTPAPSPPPMPTQPMSPRFSGTAEQYGRAGTARRRQ